MEPHDILRTLAEAQAFVCGRGGFRAPAVGVILGSGLGAWADSLTSALKLSYADIPNMPRSAVVGHAGNLVIGETPGGVTTACLQGRVHAYEGHDLASVVFGARLLARLGCKAVLITNAAGGVRRSFLPGDLMLITDHLNLMGRNPLAGPNVAELGPRFPDMTEAYSRAIRDLARAAARAANVDLAEGVYAAMLGPSYETPAEIEMARRLGADAVGMSTVPEVIALGHMGVPVGAVSCITNLAAGMTAQKLDHAEVEETARASRARFVGLLSGWVDRVGAAAPSLAP
ncbi:MAG: purine-nucleoside phosphorylase [Polyangiaceae bacterium]|jgi:purine-nucleoside phosphorylase|nr:purine-nucleoside phosphorylase [Polyangiaceae bacterium]